MIDGVIFSCFGIFVILTWPLVKAVPALFVIFYGFFSICHGVLMLIACFLHRKETYFKAVLSDGCIGILVGLVILIWSAGNKDISAQTFILFIASWFFIKGFLHFYIPAKYKRKYPFILDRVYYVIGISEFAFGIFLLTIIQGHSFLLFWSITIYFILAGIVLSVFSLKYKDISKQNESN